LLALAHRYERTQAGRTGSGQRDLLVDYEDLLADAGCPDGEARQLAERTLREAERAGILQLEHHRRDPQLVLRVRFSTQQEAALYSRLNGIAPAQRRTELAQVFAKATNVSVPQQYQATWLQFCQGYRQAALSGASVQPFSRDDPEAAASLLNLLARILGWPSESLIRFTSCVLCGDSKTLEAARPALEQLLPRATGNAIHRLRDLGIVENPRSCLVHGPLRLLLDGQWLDLGLLHGVTQLSAVDIQRAERIAAEAPRCLTVENPTSLLELSKLRGDTLLIGTNGYAGSGVLALLKRLPDTLEYWHFGDSDPAGFDILRDLRERSGRPFRSLNMRYRPAPHAPALTAADIRDIRRLQASPLLEETEKAQLEDMRAAKSKGAFEQESLGLPSLPHWPFYP